MGLIDYLEPGDSGPRRIDERGRVIVSVDPEHDRLAAEDAAIAAAATAPVGPDGKPVDGLLGRLIEALYAERPADTTR